MHILKRHICFEESDEAWNKCLASLLCLLQLQLAHFLFRAKLTTLAVSDNLVIGKDNGIYLKCMLNVTEISERFEMYQERVTYTFVFWQKYLDRVTCMLKIVSRYLCYLHMMYLNPV